MPGWTLVDNHPTQGRVFERLLDHEEVAFVFPARMKGTTDSGQYYRLRLLNSRDAHLFSNDNVVKAWLSTKRRFPLAAATIRGLKTEDGDNGLDINSAAYQAYFTVRERDLAVVRANEVIFDQVATAEKLQDQVVTFLDGPRVLSEDLLTQLRVYREIDPQNADTLHVMLFIAHVVADTTAIQTFTSCFLDTLARGGDSCSEPAQIALEERLAMAVPLAEMLSKHGRSFSVARQRWRYAIARVIFECMAKRFQGGHTLPCKITPSTQITPSRTGNASVFFTDAQTATVLANCRLHNLTFGSAYLPLAQVAMTRVLYRRYLRGEISEEEWDYRKRQPYLTVGPVSLRPRLDKEWFNKGGGGEFVLCLTAFMYRLPFMTLGAATKISDRSRYVFSDGAPPFSDLLTFNRFLYRVRVVKKQANVLLKHPMFLDIAYATSLGHAWIARLGFMQWMDGKDEASEDEALAVSDIPLVFAHGGSSRGNLDLVSPTEYPLPPTHPLSPYAAVSHPLRAGYANPPAKPLPDSGVTTGPKIVVEKSTQTLCTRPGELYLGASTSHGRLEMNSYYDRNVFEAEVVKEWLDEVKAAVLWYLGRTHQTTGASCSSVDVGGDGRPDTGKGSGILAKM